MGLFFSLALAIFSLTVLAIAVQKCRQGHFFADTPWLWWLGIFVWGDALILGLFWALSGVVFIFLSPLSIVRWWLVFWLVREAYEVVYWLNHQAVKDTYRPPFLRQVKWLNTHQVSIIYQVMAMCQVIFAGLALLFSYGLL